MADQVLAQHFTRRCFISGSGALVVSLANNSTGAAQTTAKAAGAARPMLAPDQLDSWISIDLQGYVTCLSGKIDVAQGLDVSIRLIVAEELDVPLTRVKVVMGHTGLTVNHGGATTDSGVREGGALMRTTAAEARMLLIGMASRTLGLPASVLRVSQGVISAVDDPLKRISYAELIGGGQFNSKLHWNKKFGRDLEVSGTAKPKPTSSYTVVGRPTPRADIAPKVFAEFETVADVRLPGMLHGRMLRPPFVGAVPVEVDETSIADLPGTRIVWRRDLLGVVAKAEWNAIRATKQLKVKWSDPAVRFPAEDRLHDHIRQAKVVKREEAVRNGTPDKVFETAQERGLRVIEAEYEWPFQSHASMGPACSVADVTKEHVTVYTGSQKPYDLQAGLAELLKRDAGEVTTIWVAGSGSYGRNDAGDCAADAAVLSEAMGAPVRVQYSRAEAITWDPKGSASIQKVRAALDAAGRVIAFDFMTKGFSLRDLPPWERRASGTLAGQLLGVPLDPIQAFGIPNDSYEFDHKRLGWETIPPLLDRASPLRTSHLRATASPMCHFASEQFMDELALITDTDPVAFRLQYLKDQRDQDLLRRTAKKFGWEPRTTSTGRGSTLLRGRGVAVAQKEGSCVVVFSEVEVDKATGIVRPLRFTVGHDCGLVINPRGLRQVVECQTIWAASRSLCEEVRFEPRRVTSEDWLSYPTIGMDLVPEMVDVFIVDRPNLPASGAGEHAARVVPASLANAFFDATGVRLRRAPLSPQRVLQAL